MPVALQGLLARQTLLRTLEPQPAGCAPACKRPRGGTRRQALREAPRPAAGARRPRAAPPGAGPWARGTRRPPAGCTPRAPPRVPWPAPAAPASSPPAPPSRAAQPTVSYRARHAAASPGDADQPQRPVLAGRPADCSRAAGARLHRVLRGAEHQRAPVAGQQHLHRQQARARRRGPSWLKRLFGRCSIAATDHTVINSRPAAVRRAGLRCRRRRGARWGSSIGQGLRRRGRSQQVCHGVHQDLRAPRARPSRARPAGTVGRGPEQGALGAPAGACPRPAWTPRARAGAGGAARSAARRCA